jgi:phage baseplate assembly protein W
MTALIFCLLLFIGQLDTAREVVRLPPGQASISRDYGGKLVELINAPAEVGLPSLRPSSTQSAAKWSVEIKNLGPHDVMIRSGNQLAVLLHPNESATIASRGSGYVRLH